MPAKPTRDTIAVNLELPAELVGRVRDFARRDTRTIKGEFIRALSLLLDTYDRPDSPADRPRPAGAGCSGDTLRDEAPRTQGRSVPQPASVLAQMDGHAFARLLKEFSKRDANLCYLATCRRHGLTVEQIVAGNPTLSEDEVRLQVENIERAAGKRSPP